MKPIIAIWLLLGVVARVTCGQRPPSHAVQTKAILSRAQPNREIAPITFLAASNGPRIDNLGPDRGLLNLGSFSYFARSDANHEEVRDEKDSLIVSTRFCLRIGSLNNHLAGTLTVRAFLLNPDPIRTVWVDGVRLTITPGIIGRQVAYGSVIEHVLKIKVPVSMPEGQLMDSIGVMYTAN